MNRRSNKSKSVIANLIRYALALLLAFFFVFPTLSMVVLSLQPDEQQITADMGTLYAFVPRTIGLQNYYDVANRLDVSRAFFNSFFVVSTTIISGLVINSLFAYALARLRFRGRELIITLVVALSTIPFEAIAVPLLLMVNQLPWFDTLTLPRWTWVNSYHVQIVPFIADAFSIFMFYQFFLDIPKDLEEAALIDGASRLRIFTQVIVPLSLPAYAAIAITQFVFKWGSFMWPLMTTIGPDFSPLTVVMQSLYGSQPFYWGDRLAFATLMSLPTLLVFLIFQKYFVRSEISSGVKG